MRIFGCNSSPSLWFYEEYMMDTDDEYYDTVILEMLHEHELQEAHTLLAEYDDRCFFEIEGEAHLDDTDFADPDLIDEAWRSIADGTGAPEDPAKYASMSEDAAVILAPIMITSDSGWEELADDIFEYPRVIRLIDLAKYQNQLKQLIEEVVEVKVDEGNKSTIDHGINYYMKLFDGKTNTFSYYKVRQDEVMAFLIDYQRILSEYEAPQLDGEFVIEELCY